MLKKTFKRSRFSPDTLERVKMGVTLWGERYVTAHTLNNCGRVDCKVLIFTYLNLKGPVLKTACTMVRFRENVESGQEYVYKWTSAINVYNNLSLLTHTCTWRIVRTAVPQ